MERQGSFPEPFSARLAGHVAASPADELSPTLEINNA